MARRLVVRRLKHEVLLAGGRRFQTPEIQVRSSLGDRTRAEQALEEPLEAYLALLAERERGFVSAGARQKATGFQFLAGVYRKRTENPGRFVGPRGYTHRAEGVGERGPLVGIDIGERRGVEHDHRGVPGRLGHHRSKVVEKVPRAGP